MTIEIKAPAKTLNEKLVAAIAYVEKLRAQIESEAIIADIQTGDEVTIKYGRAEKVREVQGKGVGVKHEEGKLPLVVVLSDDFETFKVVARDILANTSKDARQGEALVSDDVAVLDVAPYDELASEDPLAAA
jgi:hypothetical protein